MVIQQRVWETWRERQEFKKPAVALLLTSDATPEVALKSLSEAISEAMEPRIARAEAAGPGVEEFSPGYCSFARTPAGVLLRVAEGPDDFEGLMEAISDGLRVRGVDGQLDLYEPKVDPEIPEVVDLFECHMRLSGERVLRPNGKYDWTPHSDALARAVETGITWCRDNGAEFPLFLTVRLLPPVLVSDDHVEGLLLDGIEAAREVGVVYLTSSAPDRFRVFAIKPSTGRVALIEGGTAVKGHWQPSVRRLTDVMRAAAPWAVYAFLKRGSLLKGAILGSSLPNDWLDIPHMNALSGSRESVEDRSVPDAFGVQLLSASHGVDIPDSPDWRVQPLPSGRVLIEHVDLAAWFDGNLVRFGGHPNPYYQPFPPTPTVLARARGDFDSILYRDGGPSAWEGLGERRFLRP